MPVMSACGKRDVDWKELHDQYTSHGAYGAKDAEKVTQASTGQQPQYERGHYRGTAQKRRT